MLQRCRLRSRRGGRLAVPFTDGKYFVSEASVSRLLKAHSMITSPAYVVICDNGYELGEVGASFT